MTRLDFFPPNGYAILLRHLLFFALRLRLVEDHGCWYMVRGHILAFWAEMGEAQKPIQEGIINKVVN